MATLVPKFLARIVKGDLVIDNPPRWKMWLRKFKEGMVVEVIVRRVFKRRSEHQNAYYWGVVIELIHEHTGQDREEIHGVLASEFLTRTAWNWKTYVKSTASLTTVEFEEYLENCRRWAADPNNTVEGGIYIPLPNEVDIPKEYVIAAQGEHNGTQESRIQSYRIIRPDGDGTAGGQPTAGKQTGGNEVIPLGLSSGDGGD